MKRKVLIICLVIIGIIILGAVFAAVDYNRLTNKKEPIFCISMGQYLDGGTKEYIGLGYKIIDFNTLSGFDDVKIGPWFISYSDYEEEITRYNERLGY